MEKLIRPDASDIYKLYLEYGAKAQKQLYAGI